MGSRHSAAPNSHGARAPIVAAVILSAFAHTLLVTTLGGGRAGSPPFPKRPALTAWLVLESPSETETHNTKPSIRSLEEAARPTLQRERVSSPRARSLGAERTDGSAAATIDTPDSTYYPAKQLDVYPTLASALDLSAGSGSPDAIRGYALLLLHIDHVGTVNEVTIVEKEPTAIVDEDLTRAFKRARFTPAYKSGRPVRSRVLVRVSYGEDLQSAAATPP
jgi:outer membrane biosynthesis protein TonB